MLLVVLTAALSPLAAETIGLAPVPPAEADLAQCYAWAKVQSESLHMQEEQIEQLRQQYKQVVGAVLPNVGYNYSTKFQDTSGAGSSSSGPFYQSPQPQANFTLSQLLFSGFKELSAMKSFKHQEKAGKLQLQRGYALLYQDVSNAFYLIINLETQLANVNTAMDLSESRIKELRSWEDLGKSRHSEVVLVESQKAAYEAQAEGLKGQIDVARDLLSFLTGQHLGKAKLVDRLERVRELEAEELVLGLASTRSDVRSLQEAVDAQKSQITVARAGWYPTATATADYYNYRISFYRPIHWDAMLTVNLPLFSGGSTVAATEQAKSQLSQAQYNFELGLRQARSQIHSAYATLRSSIAQAVAAEKSFRKADECYKLQLKEYRLGLVSNLDVLTALAALLNAKQICDQSVIQSKLNVLLLKVADEQLP